MSHELPDARNLDVIATSLGLKTDLARVAFPVLLQNLQTLDRKQQDYGSTNLTKFGVHGVIVRANDKLERIINLSQKGDKVAANEPLADSFLDLANYALIAYLMHTAKWPVSRAQIADVGPDIIKS